MDNFENLLKKLQDFNIKPVDLSNDFADNIEQAPDFQSVKQHTFSEINKLRSVKRKKYGDFLRMQTYYYPRPTPQDVLVEEQCLLE